MCWIEILTKQLLKPLRINYFGDTNHADSTQAFAEISTVSSTYWTFLFLEA